MKNILILVAFLALTGCAAQRQNSSLTKEQKKAVALMNEQKIATQVESLLESKDYKITIDRAYSVSLRKPFYENTDYFYVKIKGDYLECFLPYFGKVTNQPQIGRRSPLDFSSTDFIYTLTYPTTGRNSPFAKVKIDVRNSTNNMRYDISMQVQRSGAVSINVTSPLIDAIQFSGEIKNIDYTK